MTNEPASTADGQNGDRILRTTRLVSFIVLLVIIGAFGVLSLQVMRSFMLPLFMAALLVVIFEPVHQWILQRCRERKALAAGLTTAVILLVVLAPIGWAISVGVEEAIHLAAETNPQKITNRFDVFRKSLGLEMPFRSELEAIDSKLLALQVSENADRAANEIPARGEDVLELQREVESLANQLELSAEGETSSSARLLASHVIEAQPHLESLNRRVQVMLELVRSIDKEADPVQVRRYDELAREMGDSYRSLRLSLLGGVVRAPAIELANPSAERVRGWKSRITDTLRGWMLRLSGQTTSLMGNMLMQLFVLVFALFYFLLDGEQMVNSAIELSPIEDRYEREMIAEFAKLSRAVVLATLLSAIAQGALAGIGYFAVWQFQSLFVLIILTALLAMVPFVGAAAVWVPVCLYVAFVEERYLAALLLAVWGAAVVSMADNIIKPWVLKGQSNLHPLFALLSVLGGVKALGPIGVLIGPMLLAFLQSLLLILHRVLKRMDEEKVPDA